VAPLRQARNYILEEMTRTMMGAMRGFRSMSWGLVSAWASVEEVTHG